MQTTDILHTIEELACSCGLSPMEIRPIAESGSARRYFRIVTEKRSVIGTYGSNIEENEAFLSFCRHFHDLKLNVPEVFAVNAEKNCYLQSDFGDDTLFGHVQKALKTGHPSAGSGTFDESLIELYKKALKHLVRFQYIGNLGLDYRKAYPAPRFDRQAILDDFNYFKYYFVKPHEEIDFNETRLNRDFEAFADFLGQAPSDYFMYRDFQSRNIMVKDSELYFIDFQGGRKGPLNYDVVSLLYQVKAQMPQAVRDQLVQSYKEELSQFVDPATVKFDDHQPYFVYLRLLQVLGSYGFRGLIQKKPHFIESIPYALKELETWNGIHPLDDYPELQNVISQLPTLSHPLTRNAKRQTPNAKLTVTINSFSYRKGYPDDFSGNGGGFVFDCRALPNPGRLPEFKDRTGRDWEVIDYLVAKPQVQEFLDNVKSIVKQSVDNYIERHFNNLMVSFGCTGGQHRSVFFAQTTYDWLKQAYPNIHLKLNHIEQKTEEESGL